MSDLLLAQKSGVPYQAKLNIGLLGGSFNPAHHGHIHISLAAIRRLRLDQVWWMVSPQNPLKSSDDMGDFKVRFDHAKSMTADYPNIVVTDIENHLDSNYTSQTLPQLKHSFPNFNFVWMMGTDNWLTVHQWEQWHTIFATMPVVVFPRRQKALHRIKSSPASLIYKNYQVPADQNLIHSKTPAWGLLKMPEVDISATEIRNRLKNKGL